MNEQKTVGLVIGTRKSNPLEFWVGVSPGKYLQLDDVVFLRSKLPEGQEIIFYGLVDIVEKSFEGLSFDSDNQLVQDGILPASLSHVARVTITRIEPEIFVPPNPGDAVFQAKNEQLDIALSYDNMDFKLPMGIMRNGEVGYINYEFIDGTKGGHISISGISGVTTKTSYALFLLSGIFNSGKLSAEQKNSSRAIIFNVKGEDLFFIDKANLKLDTKNIGLYEKLNLKAGPFNDVKLFAPARIGREILPDTESRQIGIQPYGWTLWELAHKKLFRFVFAEDDNSISNIGFLIKKIENHLSFLSSKCKGPYLEDSKKLGSLGDLISHLQDLVDDFDKDDPVASENFYSWFGKNTAINTVSAFMRRLEAAAIHLKPLIRADMKVENSVKWQDQKVTLVDINKLHTRAKMFVVGAILNKLFQEKEEQGSKPTVFIVLDELNRYAPRNGWSPIKEILLDIAERGRSLGIILIGAQQTASEIEPRILANAAIKINGRLDSAESTHKEYDHLGGSFRKRSLMIRPGTMIVHQPELSSPILVNYPFPAWATRKNEVADNPEEIKKDIYENF